MRQAAAHLLADPELEPPSARREKLRRNMQFQALRLAMIADDAERAGALVAALGAPDLLASTRIAQRARELALPAFAAELAGRWPQVVECWQAALQTPDALEWYGLLTEGRLRLAAALVRLGRQREAAQQVEAAALRCASDGWIGSALLAGPRALATLAHGGMVLGAGAQAALANWLDSAERLRGHRAPRADAHGRRRQQQADRAGLRPEPAHGEAACREHPRQAGRADARSGSGALARCAIRDGTLKRQRATQPS